MAGMVSEKQRANLAAPFDSAGGRAAAARRKVARGGVPLVEPTEKVMVVLYARQADRLRELGVNRSAILRNLLEDWLATQP